MGTFASRRRQRCRRSIGQGVLATVREQDDVTGVQERRRSGRGVQPATTLSDHAESGRARHGGEPLAEPPVPAGPGHDGSAGAKDADDIAEHIHP
jgi:hypothetical protein